MKERSNFIESLQFILKRHLNSDEKLRTVSIVFDTEVKKKFGHKSSREVPVVFSKVSKQASHVKSRALIDHPLNKLTQEPHPASAEINRAPEKMVSMDATGTNKPLNNQPWEFEPQYETILSIREKEIIGILAQGYSHKMIAGRLGISINTVRNHFRRIHFKLSVHSNTQVLLKVLKTGIFKTKVLFFLYFSATSSMLPVM